jgi:hypothetical protein
MGNLTNLYSGREAYLMVAAEMYFPGEVDYQTPDEVLAFLEPAIVANAERYAKDNHLAWPPLATTDVPMIRSL